MAPDVGSAKMSQAYAKTLGVGFALKQNSEVCSAIKESNFEIASHGWRWIDYQSVEEKLEKEHIIRCYQEIKEIFGNPPSGWYTGRCSPNTRRLVVENTDVIYDSDSYADDLPYWEIVNNKKHLIIPFLKCWFTSGWFWSQ